MPLSAAAVSSSPLYPITVVATQATLDAAVRFVIAAAGVSPRIQRQCAGNAALLLFETSGQAQAALAADGAVLDNQRVGVVARALQARTPKAAGSAVLVPLSQSGGGGGPTVGEARMGRGHWLARVPIVGRWLLEWTATSQPPPKRRRDGTDESVRGAI